MDIMNAIADIEKKSQEILNSANELEKNRNEILAEEIRKREEAMNKKLSEKCEAIKRKSEAECSEGLAVLEENYRIRLENIKSRCEKYTDKWVNEIYNAVIK